MNLNQPFLLTKCKKKAAGTLGISFCKVTVYSLPLLCIKLSDFFFFKAHRCLSDQRISPRHSHTEVYHHDTHIYSQNSTVTTITIKISQISQFKFCTIANLTIQATLQQHVRSLQIVLVYRKEN